MKKKFKKITTSILSFILFVCQLIPWQLGFISGPLWPLVKPAAATNSLTKTSLADWQEGKYEWNEINVATSSGDLKLQLDLGSWDTTDLADMGFYAYPSAPMVKVGRFVYMIRNRYYGQFMRYDLDSREWKEMAFLPHQIYEVADLTTDGSDYIYALATRHNTGSGQTYKHFLRYDIAADSWEYLAETPADIKAGAFLEYVAGLPNYIYAIQGYDSSSFWRYNVSTNTWEVLQNSTYYCQWQYCNMVYDGNQYLYLYTSWYAPDRFFRYDTINGSWTRLADMPGDNLVPYPSPVKVGDYLYLPRGNSTRTFYRYSISGNSWDTAADLPGTTSYVSTVYDDDDNRIIVYGGATSFWYYYPDTNSWSQGMGGPPVYSAYSSGNSLVSDNSGNLYYIRGSNNANVYKYDLTLGIGATWSSFTSLPAAAREGAALAWDGTYLYASLGEAGANFYRCNPSSCSWSSLANFPITPSAGAAMAASGSASLWYSRGAGQTHFYRYDISGNSWTQKTGPPEGVYRGSSMLQIGDFIYLLQGYNSGGLFRYSETENAWTRMASLPVGSYYGGGATYDGNDYIYAAVAGDTDIYSRQFYRYSISQNRWERMADTPEMVKNGAGIAYSAGKVYLVQGNYSYGFWKYTPPSGENTYTTSGFWYSPAYDLTYVSSWGTFASTKETPSGTGVAYYSRTSDNGNKWSDWEEISGGVIASPAKRYIQIKITMTSDGDNTPTVSDFTINYTGDETAPVMTGLSVSGYSQSGGDSLTSGESYSHTNPYFSWSGVTDAASGVEGYYVYFGSSASADPAVLGAYQYTTDYTVSSLMENGTTYYLRIKAKDKAGNISSATTGFVYGYNGISPASSITVSTQADWDDNEASRSGVYTGSSSWWNVSYNYRRQLTVTAGSGGLTTSSVVKVDIDTSALETAGKVRPDRKDWRILYWDGIYWEEVARDYESASETLFNPVRSIAAGQSDTNYYLYYGNADESTEAKSASLKSRDVFLSFDGSNDYVLTNWSDNNDTRTYTAWINYSGSGTYSIIHSSSSFYNFQIRIGGGTNLVFRFRSGSSLPEYSATILPINDNSWHHIALVHEWGNSTNTRLYVDGVRVTGNWSGDGSLVLTSFPPLWFGFGGWSSYFPGYLDDVRIYNRALSEEEITTIYSNNEVSSGLLGHWKFDEGSGQVVGDSSGNGYDAYLGSTSNPDDNDPVWRTSIIASVGEEAERPEDEDTDLVLEPMTEGSWAGYQMPSLPRNLRFAYGAAAYANGALYVLRGYNSKTFYKLDLSTGAWTQLTDAPNNIAYTSAGGATLVWDGNDALYAHRGYNTAEFYKYTISTNTWSDEQAADPPMNFYYGAAGVKAGNYIYYARGNGAAEFLRYDLSNNSWKTLSSSPYGVTYGSGLVWDGGDVIWLQNGTTGLSKYSISANSWAANNTIALMPYEGGDAYNDLVYYNGYIYTFTHVNQGYSNDAREYVWRYDIAKNRWERVTTNLEFGPLVGAVAYDGIRYVYLIQGLVTTDQGTRSLYRFDLQTHNFFPETPPLSSDRYFIDTDGEYMYPRPYTGTSLAYDGDDTIYYIMGSDDEFKFKKYVISKKKWFALPPIPCWYVGGGMSYAEGYLYAVCGNTTQYFFRYDEARENWEQLANTPDTIGAAGNQGLVYAGNGVFYLLRGRGSTTLYKYENNNWTIESNSIPGTIGNSYGASITYDGSDNLYIFRGNNTTSFYKYKISTQEWTTLTPAPKAASYGSGSIYDNGRIYFMQGNNTTNMYVYDIASDTWMTGPSTLSEVYAGGALTKGPGNTAYATAGYYDMLFWKFNLPSSSSSYVYEGSFTSKIYDLGNPYRFAGLQATVASPSATLVDFETRTSTDSAHWNDWTAASNLKKNGGTTFSLNINSTPARYFQFRVTLSSPESASTPTVSDVTVYYYNDETPPIDPDTLSSYTTATKAAEINTNTWYNLASPHFDWSGATDVTGSGIAGYWVYFGTDPDADASVSGNWQTSASYTASLSEDGDYYLKIKTKDNAGNTSDGWAPFVYRYDGTPPNRPASVAADPRTYTSVNSFTLFWSAVEDQTSNATSSGLLGYYYKTGAGTGIWASDRLTSATTLNEVPAYQDGTNVFYVKSVDNAGNVSDYTTTSYYYNGNAPSPPLNLTVTPSYSTSNSFAFDWDEPAQYQGSISEYRYSVNTLPTATNYTAVSTSALTAGPYATVKGKNVLYVVAVDEAGNVNYNAYASVEFEADTSAPGIPQSLEAFDNSIRATKQYKVGLTWDPPSDLGTGFAGYAIYASDTETECNSTASNFTRVGATGGSTYVVADIAGIALESKTYYFCIRAYDTTNQYSAASSTVSLWPTGRWLTAPDLTSEPAAAAKTKSATITWTTSRTANSFVKYGTSPGDYGNEVGSSDQVTSHSIQVTGLKPGTTYYYKVLWTDEDGNQGISGEYNFTTNAAPFVSNVEIKDIGIYSAYVSFTISNASLATVQYGKTTAYGGTQTVTTSTAEGAHAVKLDNLEEGTEYHLRIVGEDEEGNTYEGDDYSFETLPVPKILSVKIQQVVGMPTATIRVLWTSNTDISSIITYYPTDSPSRALDQISLTLTKNHEMVIKNLADETDYTLVVKGKDIVGNEAVFSPQSFKTATDLRSPLIVNFNVESTITGVGEGARAQIIVSWDTDEPATTQVEYAQGTGTEYNSKTQEDNNLTFNHVVTIPDLRPATIYHLRAVSKDKAGNIGYSFDSVIITPKATRSALDLVIEGLGKTFTFLGGFSLPKK